MSAPESGFRLSDLSRAESFDTLESILMKIVGKAVKRFDLGEMRSATRTPQGFLMCPGFATRTGVFPYLDGDGNIRRELRHPDDVFDPVSLATLKYAPVTVEHPPVMLDPKNVAQYSKGHTTERVEVNRDMVDTDLIIEHQDAIDAVENEGIRELSSGYLADIVEEEGVFNGAPYNFRQKNIRYNHLAMVRRGRAGPEVRMRLDSADAVMRTDDISIPKRGEFSQESSVSDAEEPVTKKLVILGREIDLPADEADAMQDLLDRYDEMRAKLSELEEAMSTKARKDKKDVDINQKGISPQVKVEQQGPDGRSAGGKTAAKPGTITGPVGKADDEEEKDDEDEHGIVGGVKSNSRGEGGAELKDDDDEKEHDDDDEHDDAESEGSGMAKGGFKNDFEGGNAASGGGAAMPMVEQLKKDMKDMYDNFMGKMDAMAASSMSAGEAKPDRMDSKDVQKQIRARVKLERQASQLVPFEVAKKFDSMSDDQVRAAVIKHKSPKADLEGKSSVYLQSRFDSLVETLEETGAETRRNAGRAMLGLVSNNGERTDSADAEVDPTEARRKMINGSRDLWKSDLSARKKN